MDPIVLVLFGSVLYVLPSLLAKHKRNAVAIVILNLLLGWTVIGWIGALLWALVEKPKVVVSPYRFDPQTGRPLQ